MCLQSCIVRPFLKLGDCPSTSPPLTMACLNECRDDALCPTIDKCCPHKCGVTCKTPINLHRFKGLPMKVFNISISERRRSRIFLINWAHNELKKNNIFPTLFIVEERHHPGRQFRESALGPWNTIKKNGKLHSPIKFRGKPGLWYQVRIASVNSNGSLGFSEPSYQFKLVTAPNPPEKPLNLTFSNLLNKNGTFSGLFSWRAPESDLPINKFTVYWFRKIKNEETPFNEGSFLVNSRIVNPDITSYRIKNLNPEVLYYFEVCAHSQYGKYKLTGNKSAIIVNVSLPLQKQIQPLDRPGELRSSRNKNIEINTSPAYISNNKPAIKIIWKSKPEFKYVIMWESINCGLKESKSIVALSSPYELKQLKYDCKYQLQIREKNRSRKFKRSGKIFFTTPSCNKIYPNSC